MNSCEEPFQAPFEAIGRGGHSARKNVYKEHGIGRRRRCAIFKKGYGAIGYKVRSVSPLFYILNLMTELIIIESPFCNECRVTQVYAEPNLGYPNTSI